MARMVAQRSDILSMPRPEDPPAAQQTLAAPSPVELEVLLPLFAGDAEFRSELIDTFLRHGDAMRTNIRAALSRKDNRSLTSAAHSLKGAAGEIGAVALARAAAELESAGRAERTVAIIEPLLLCVESELRRVDAFLRGMLDPR